MSLSALWQIIFHVDVPPDPKSTHNIDEIEVRWNKLKLDAIKRRAKELNISVDIGTRFKYDRHS